MPQPTDVSDFVKERLALIRGELRLYNDLRPTETAFVVIDMQNAFVAEGGVIEVPASREIIPVINRMAAECRELGVPVIWIRSHHPKGGSDWRHFFDHFVRPERREAAAAALSDDAPSSRFHPDMDIHDEDYIVFKNRYSCLIPGSSSLERLVRSLGCDTLLLAGTKTNICVESTARDAMMLDFRVVVLSDATAALTDEEHQASLNVLIQEFADILVTDEVVEELRANAGGADR
ncbi:MAG: cysteine hydrolase [bacterium]|nr:cysteine hydrolase [bacterium]MCY4102052.1 cysteine hydrolase [bacterium]